MVTVVPMVTNSKSLEMGIYLLKGSVHFGFCLASSLFDLLLLL